MTMNLHPSITAVAGSMAERITAVTVAPRLVAANEVIDWQSTSDDTYTDPASSLRVTVKIEQVPSHRAVIIRSTLTNNAHGSPVRLNELDVLRLHFDDLTGARVRQVGGGVQDGAYPPEAYRVCDQLVRTHQNRIELTHGPNGRSSDRDLPMLMITINGGGMVAAMEWSSLWYQRLTGTRDAQLNAGIPIHQLVMEPGESLELPPVHLIFFDGDLDDGGNALRRYIYDRLTPDIDGQRPQPPISYDHWFGIRHNYDETLILKQVDRCAELGLDYFVLDAAWYAGSDDGFPNGLGNWTRVHARRFPNGLEALAQCVAERGMKFGLWFEPERADRDSDLAREHADWCIDIGKQHLHLNLALPAAQDYVIDMIGTWIEKLDLRWSRWDYNARPLPYWEAADPTGKLLFGYQAGLNRVLDTLTKRYPQWLVECCASGGRRIDFATLRRAHTAWFSDQSIDPQLCRFMQTGANRMLPGNFANSSVAVHLGAGDAGLTDADVLSRMCGAFALNGDVASWTKRLTRRVRKLIDGYRDFRHLLTQNFYPLTRQPMDDTDWDVVSFVSYDADEAVVMAYRFAGTTDRLRVALRGLNEKRTYQMTDPFGRGKPKAVTGADLMHRGVDLSLAPNGAKVLRLQAV